MHEYEVRPIPYLLLDDEGMRKAEETFISMARALANVTVLATHDEEGTQRFVLRVNGDDFDTESILESLGIERCEAASLDWEREGKKRVMKRHLDSVPSRVRAGLIAKALSLGIDVEENIRLQEDLSWLNRTYSLLQSLGNRTRQRDDVAYMIENAESEGIFEVSVKLAGSGEKIRAWARSNGIGLSRYAARIVIAGSSLAAFFPFSSYEVSEKGGVRLGKNSLTGSQVVYDFFSRRNYNVPVIGPSGSGKSALLKIIAYRLHPMLSTLSGSQMVIMDPEGEYGKLASALKLEEVKLEEVGLDPFSTLPPGEACELLSSMLDLNRSERHLLETVSVGRGSTRELLTALEEQSSAEARQLSLALSSLLDGPFSSAFDLPPSRIPSRAILTFPRDQRRRELTVPLSLALTWENLKQAPADVPKVLIIDEGWLFLSKAQWTLENVVRLGRKLNLLVFFASQRPADFISTSSGRVLMENSSTKILLKQDEDALPELSSFLRLGEREQAFLRSIPSPKSKGYSQALLIDEWRRLPVNVLPEEDEVALI
ncbi:MAG: VirB4 family type IV secretion system protein [Thermoprotei archaeon]